MFTLKDVSVNTKRVELEFPGIPGFNITLSAVSRELSKKIKEDAEFTKIDPKHKVPVTAINEDKFVSKFAETAILGWKGLKYKHLPELMLVDLSGVEDSEQEVPYNLENAIELLKQSQIFDSWVNDVVFDITRFRD